MKSVAGALAAVLFFVCGGPVGAQPAPLPIKLSLAYDGSLFIKVLDIQFDQDISASGFSSNVHMRSYGVLALFKHFDIRADSQGRLDGGEVRPGLFNYLNRDGERVRDVKVAWRDKDVAITSAPAFGSLGDPPASLDQKVASADPLTQVVRLAISQNPCGHTSRFFDGKQLYALSFGPPQTAGLNDRERSIGLVNPVGCPVRYEEIAGFKRKSPAKRNGGLNGPIEAVFGQFGSGGPWVFASLSADTPLGKAHIVLSRAQLTR